MAGVVRTPHALTLVVWKKYALTLGVWNAYDALAFIVQ